MEIEGIPTQKPFPLLNFAPFPSSSSIEGKLSRWRNCIGASQLLLSSPLLAKIYPPPRQPALLQNGSVGGGWWFSLRPCDYGMAAGSKRQLRVEIFLKKEAELQVL